MTDIINIRDYSNTSQPVLCDNVTDGTLGTGFTQQMKIMDGTVGSTNKLVVDSSGRLTVVLSTKSSTGNSPTAVSVGTSSTSVLSSNASRKGLVLVNTSANFISLGLDGAAAVLYSGITLTPNGGTWVMDSQTYTTGAIHAIASVASSNLSVQEMQ